MNKKEHREAVEAKHNPPWEREECEGLDPRVWAQVEHDMEKCKHCRAEFLGLICPICKKERS